MSDYALAGIYIVQDGRLTYVNPALAKIFGYAPEELIGADPLTVVHPDDHALVTENMRRRTAGEIQSLEYEFRGRCKNGASKFIQVLGARVDLDGRPAIIGNVLDITERKRAEEALRESEGRYQLALRAIDEGIWEWNIAENNVYISSRWKSILGYADHEIQNQAGVLEKYVHPDDWQKTSALLQDYIEGRVPRFETEFRAQHKDGAYRWIRSRAILVRDADGKPLRIIGAHEDITERRRAEEALRESQALLRAQFENSPDLIMVVDREYRYVSLNKILFGSYTIEELIGKDALAPLPENVRGMVKEKIDTCFSAGSIQAFEHEVGDGNWAAARIVPLPHASASDTVMIVSTNITDRKRAEDQVRESEARYRALVETSPDSITLTDLNATVVMCNRQTARLLGYANSEEMNGMSALALFPPEELERAGENMTKTMQHGIVNDIEYTLLKKDGARFPALLSAAMISDQEGKPAGFMAVVRDISERKRAEETLRASEARFAKAFRANPAAVAITKMADSTIIDANENYERLFGYSRAELIGHTTLELNLFVDLAECARVAEQLRDQGAVHNYESLLRTRSGELRNTWISLDMIELDGEPCILSIIYDVTDRRRAEQQLRTSENNYRTLMEQASDGIFIADANGNYTDVNSQGCAMLGYTRKEILRLNMKDVLLPEDLAIVPVRLPVLVTGKTILSERFMRRKDGSIFPAEISGKRLSDGRLQGIVRDISERKQREKELQVIASLSAALRAAPTRAEMLPVIVEQLSGLLHCNSVSVEIIDPITHEAVVEAAHGVWHSIIGFRQSPNTGLNAVIAKTRQPYLDNHIQDQLRKGDPAYVMDGVSASAGVPLIAQDQLVGYLWIGRAVNIVESDVQLLVAVADIAANAIHRATLHEQTQRAAAELARAYDTTLEGWARALELRDQETEGHTRRVAQKTFDLARAMGVSENEMENLRRGALLHDVGKMGIPDSVLLKPGTLNDREWEIMVLWF